MRDQTDSRTRPLPLSLGPLLPYIVSHDNRALGVYFDWSEDGARKQAREEAALIGEHSLKGARLSVTLHAAAAVLNA